MMKKILIIIFFAAQVLIAQTLQFGQAKGLFMSIGVGPRAPVSQFSESHNLGAGANISLLYTDNLVLPLFLKGEIGYQHLPGKQSFYKSTNYSAISTNIININIGARHYFSPLVEQVVLLMPVVEAGASVGYFETSNQFKIGSSMEDFDDNEFKVGFHAGIGVSMFLLDAMVYYNYFKDRQYFALDLRVTLPVAVAY